MLRADRNKFIEAALRLGCNKSFNVISGMDATSHKSHGPSPGEFLSVFHDGSPVTRGVLWNICGEGAAK